MDKKLEKKNKIIKNSIDLMYLNGFNGTSVKDITDAAGIPKGSFYNYFEDKEHYLIDSLNYYFFYMNKEKIQILKDVTLNPISRIENFFTKAIKEMEDSNYKYGCFLGNTAQELGDTNDIIGKEIKSINNIIINIISNNLDEAYEKKGIKNSLNTTLISGFILSAWQGSLLRAKISSDGEPLKEFMEVLTEKIL